MYKYKYKYKLHWSKEIITYKWAQTSADGKHTDRWDNSYNNCDWKYSNMYSPDLKYIPVLSSIHVCLYLFFLLHVKYLWIKMSLKQFGEHIIIWFVKSMQILKVGICVCEATNHMCRIKKVHNMKWNENRISFIEKVHMPKILGGS